jgi:GAF domain-containing protein
VSETPGVEDDAADDLSANLALVARALSRAGSVDDTLRAIVDLALDSIEGCEYANFFSPNERSRFEMSDADRTADDVGALQRRLNEGPCIDTNTGAGAIFVGDLTDEERWPRFTPDAIEMGIRTILAVQLFGNDPLGTLAMYSHFPFAFGIADRAKALLFATIAGLALAAAHAHESEERRVEQLRQALATRELIGQAQGILMERERITADQAFGILRVASQHLNVKLRDVARDLVDTGEAPPGAPAQGRL